MFKKSYLLIGLCLVVNLNGGDQNSKEVVLLNSPEQAEILELQDYSGLIEGVNLAAQIGSGDSVTVDIADLKKIAPEAGAEIDKVCTEILAQLEQQERAKKRSDLITAAVIGLLAGVLIFAVRYYKKQLN